MSIFGSILSKLFPSASAAEVSATPSASGAPKAPAAPGSVTLNTDAAPGAAPGTVDVAAILTGLASKADEKLDWKSSIVDLLKVLNLDSSFSARKELAHELGYTGDSHDSASMNIWLHKEVWKKLAENGGKVPDDLKV